MRTVLFIQRIPGRLSCALLLSLIGHALLLSMALGGQTFGLPELNFPWKERRLGANDLRISLAPAQSVATASAAPPEESKPVRAAANDAPPGDLTPPPRPTRAPTAAPVQPAEPVEPSLPVQKRPDVNLPIAPNAPAIRASAPVPIDAAGPMQKQLDQARLEQETQSAERLRQTELKADAQREAARQEQLRQNNAARMEVERLELARQEGLRREAMEQERTRQVEKAQQDAARQELEQANAARQEQARQAQLEAARQDALKKAAALQDAGKQEKARLEAARQEAIKLEAAQQEVAKRDAARQEAARLEAAKREVTRQDALKQDAERQEAARQDALKHEAARQGAAKQEAARQERAKQDLAQRERAEEEAKREERLRAIGKQLNAEAAQRDPSKSLLPTVSSLRRGWLLGRTDPNSDLVLYAETMSQKIEMNMTFDMVRDVVKQSHVRPIVTVAIRADGSVEKVTFVVSSGVPAIDDAIRKVVASQAPYAAFPPNLARQYDVIEIRRTWIFDIAIRLQ